MSSKGKLTPRQLRFCQKYAVSQNGTEAARAAGYAKASAAVKASKLLRKANISAKIAELLSKSTAAEAIRLSDIIAELKILAFSSMGSFATWTAGSVSLIPKARLSTEAIRAVEAVSETSDAKGNTRVRIKLFDKVQALQALIRCFELIELSARIAKLEESLSVKGEGK